MNTSILIISTSNTSEPAHNEILITAHKKATAANPVLPDERYRSVCIPAWDLSPFCTDSVRPILLEALISIAKAKLFSIRDRSTVDSKEFSIPSLRSFHDSLNESKRVTSESIEIWFRSTATYTKIMEKRSAETAMKYAELYKKLASPNSGIQKQEATALLGTLVPTDCIDSHIGEFVASKLQTIIEKPSAFSIELL